MASTLTGAVMASASLKRTFKSLVTVGGAVYGKYSGGITAFRHDGAQILSMWALE